MSINPESYAGMVVCGDCGDVVGPFEHADRAVRLEDECFDLGPRSTYVQRGRCPTHTSEGNESRWPRFDYNRLVELCNCCGAVPLRSGSKWSVWFCDACKQQVQLLNGRHGRCVVPIGRHSVHAGWLLTGDQIENPLEVEAFVSSMSAISDGMCALHDWRRIVVRRNLEPKLSDSCG
jgi:hypothetical protein